MKYKLKKHIRHCKQMLIILRLDTRFRRIKKPYYFKKQIELAYKKLKDYEK